MLLLTLLLPEIHFCYYWIVTAQLFILMHTENAFSGQLSEELPPCLMSGCCLL